MTRRVKIPPLFKVTGRGQFPIDMLRYDSCVPASELDSYEIARFRDLRTIELRLVGENRPMGPTEGRWHSFGWTVEPA